MPLMTKIRDNMTTFFSVFAGVFVVYIVLDWGMDITGRRQSSRMAEASFVGKIDGESISIHEYNDLVKAASDNQKAQSGAEPDENQLRTVREQVWNQMVEQRLFDREIRRLGITVSDKEVYDMLLGDNPPEFLKRQFTDSTGTFNRQQYEATIKDVKNRSIIVRVEQELRKQREREKLQSIVMASVQVSEGDVVRRFQDQTMKYEGDYALFDPNILVKDDEIKFTDDDVRKFYNDHADEFKVEATRRLKYVMFNQSPSRADSDGVATEMLDIKRRAEAGAEFLELVKTYSDAPATDAYFKHGELSQEKDAAVFAAKTGEILEPIHESDGYHLIKVLDSRAGKEEFIHASHILIRIQNPDSAKSLKTAKELFAKAKGGADFASLARQNSSDGSASNGGDLGWFGKGRMVKEFEAAAFKAKVGQVVGPVRTQFGYHIIKVTGHENREVKIADIQMPVRMSLQTKNDIEQKAQEFQYHAKEVDFAKEAAQDSYSVVETPPFQKDAGIPGIGLNSGLNKFAFNDKLGTVSEIVSLQNGFGVFMVSEVKQAGIRPFDELKSSLESRLKRERKLEKMKSYAQTLRQSLGANDSLQKITSANAGIQVGHFPATPLNGALPGIGRDLNVIGALSTLNVNQISNPVEGQRGWFILKLASRTPFDSSAYAAQKDMMRNQLLSEKRNRFFTDWLADLKKSAEIVDSRDAAKY